VLLDGDANFDGTVNLSDFNVLAANFGQSVTRWSQADFTFDGTVNLSDFNSLAGNFGLSAAAGGPTPQDWSKPRRRGPRTRQRQLVRGCHIGNPASRQTTPVIEDGERIATLRAHGACSVGPLIPERRTTPHNSN
jgi:hypothetical protein